MPHDLSLYDFKLPSIEDWISGDDRTLAFQVTDDQSNGIDVSGATITWLLADREYVDDPADAVLTESDSGVSIDTSGSIDPTVGEFEVVVDGEATDDKWGRYYHRPRVEAGDGTVSSWLGEAIITA